LGGGGIAPGVVAAGTRVTWYLQPDNAGGLSFEYEKTTPASGTATNVSRHYLNVGGVAIGMLEATGTLPAPSGTAPATIASITLVKVEYWHKDSLGSLVATTDQTGAVTDRYAYDPFGKRRFTTGAYDGAGALVGDYTTGTSSGTARGFTGHEHIDEIGLIHMNGRLFDATSGRFMQADPMIGDPQDLGAYNRYAYCGNNPMGCVDPTGYCFLGCFWHASHLVADWHQLWGNQVIRSIAIAVAAYYTGSAAASVFESSEAGTVGADGYAAAATTYAAQGSAADAEAAAIAAEDATTSSIAAESALVNEAVGGLTAGLLGSNGNLKAGLEGAAFGMANGYIGDLTTSGALSGLGNAAAHLVLGCVQGVAGHSKCGGGALSAGFTALFENQYQKNIYGVIEASVVGGTASVIGGGKFVNGAEVAAFMYLYNHCNHVEGGCWSALKDAASMATDWATGSGPDIRVFGPGSIQVVDMMDAPGVNSARDFFYDKNATAIASGSYDSLQAVTNYAASFGLTDLFTTSSPTQHFVGSYRIDIWPVNNGSDLMFVLSNTSSFRSFAYGIAPDWSRSTFGHGGNMQQTFWWTEPRRQ
jgi:RHS repeat-associated protein